MKANTKRRIACLSLSAVMAVTFAAGNALAFAKSGKNGLKTASGRYDTVTTTDVTGKIDMSGVALKNLSSSVLENAGISSSFKDSTQTVIVRLEGDSLIEAMPEGADTSEYLSSYDGGRKLRSINSAQTNLLNTLTSLDIDYKVVYKYNTVTNAVAIEVNTKYLSGIKSLPQVKSVYVSETYAYPQTVKSSRSAVTTNPSNVYPTGIYDSSDCGYDGSGTTVAILDTGLDYTHEAFSKMPDTLAMDKSYVAKKLSEKKFTAAELSANKGKNITVDDVYVNAKVPFAYDYADKDADVYPSYSQHGTHVAGIVAGQADSYTDKDGNIATDANGNKISFRGAAPEAQLVICKVFTDDFNSKDLGGATSEDIIAALEDCVNLGVDVINMSLGTSAGFSSIYIEGDDEGQALNKIYEEIRDAGISLICAASNESSSGAGGAFGTNLATNPDSGTVGSPSTFTGAISVGSINGQLSSYMISNGDGKGNGDYIFFDESSDSNGIKRDFVKSLLGDKPRETFKYVIIDGMGEASDYTQSVMNELKDKSQGRTIAVISRGKNTFKDKIEILMSMGLEDDGTYTGADGVIIYNNVAGTVGMNVGEIENAIPAVSVNMDAGKLLRYDGNTKRNTGTIELCASYQAGPFMNDYSSWGTTPDLKLKPDITAHGGEIISTVAGGYEEMSGTSMASPNLAGFTALLRGKLKAEHPEYSPSQLTKLTNQLMMSTAITVYDREGLPYSPRKQGSGLATLSNVFSTNAYLSTEVAEDNRPKIEFGEDEKKNGVYTLDFAVTNFGDKQLSFNTKSIFFTETLASGGLAVAEKAHMFNSTNYADHIPAQWTVDKKAVSEGGTITVAAGSTAQISVKLTLSNSEKNYLDRSFANGMFIEGFLKLESTTEGQCDLTLPFMGFYGDWESAPMLDYDCYEISDFQQDTNYDDNTRPQASVWATQAYGTYTNEKYSMPLGSYLYTQDPDADQIYVDREHAVISRFDDYQKDRDASNYLTIYSIRALYAGLLRNAELVTYDLLDTATGELIKRDEVYRVNKARASGGSSVPAQVLLDLKPDDLGLVNNGKYQLDFHFYFKAEDKNKPEKQNDDNSFSMVFYVDYEAPVLADSRIRYYDYNDSSNRPQQKVYLDLDIYDNTYAQSVILCYQDGYVDGVPNLKLATKYITPVYRANKNGITTVSIEITDFYEKYNERLFVQIDDYAFNHRVHQISFSNSSEKNLPSEFEVVGDTEITLGVNQVYKVALDFKGEASISNFTWTSSKYSVAKVKNGEIFAVAPGTATITIGGANGSSKRIKVNVVESNTVLPNPAISFGTIENSDGSLVKATGTVNVNAGEKFKLDIVCNPWYYPAESLKLVWTSTNADIAEVDEYGNVKIKDTKGSAQISATLYENGIIASSANVLLRVQEPFTISNYTLTRYHGNGGVVKIPDDKNINAIGEEAFKDNDNITKIIIPRTVTQISEKAFINCKALKEVYFISEETIKPADAKLSTIRRRAFYNCTALEKIDFSNCKVITLDAEVFAGCVSLKEVVNMTNIGTMNDRAFYGCKSLERVDATGLHICGESVFENCTSVNELITGAYTAIGKRAFYGCKSLKTLTINNSAVSDSAFENCIGLESVDFVNALSAEKDNLFTIGARAFRGCNSLTTVTFSFGGTASVIGDKAFANCRDLQEFTLPEGLTNLGDSVFENSPVTIKTAASGSFTVDAHGTVYNGTKLMLAPKKITAGFEIAAGTTEIAPYAFSGCAFADGKILTVPDSVTKIGEGAFANSNLSKITLPAALSEISAHMFAGAALTEFTVGANIKTIGQSAFAENSLLETLDFASATALESIGEGAFADCNSLKAVTLPESLVTLGASAFLRCYALESAVIPSVTEMGNTAFAECRSLERVTFGGNATVTGAYTFYNCTALNSVTLGDAITSIGEGAFGKCSALESINLNNVTTVESNAFALCTALANVTNLDKIETIGANAFGNCGSLTELNLANAKFIGDGAFANTNYTKLSIPKAETIGDKAFYGGRESLINLPASLKSLGAAAFAKSVNLKEFVVDEANENFFTEDGVLYRVINAQDKTYELCAYPTAKVTPVSDSGTRIFRIKEGTVTIQAYAFANLNVSTIYRVELPYSVKTIGARAFYGSRISEFSFESINAPALLTEYTELGGDTSNLYLYYENFYDAFVNHVDGFVTSPKPSTMRLFYPTNGKGYDNYIYSNYFGEKKLLGELMDDTTREFINAVKSFDIEEINSWNNLEVNDANRAAVSSYSNKVKAAHELYNTITEQAQLNFLVDKDTGVNYLEHLYAVEEALKPVKSRFGISAKVTSLTVSPDSTHKSHYKAGEKFDMTGLVLIVNYDDFTTSVADLSKIAIAPGYDGELSELNVYVILQGYGVTINLSITVDGSGADVDEGGSGKTNVGLIVGCVIGGICFIAAATVAVGYLVLFLKKKSNSGENGEATATDAEAEEAQENDVQTEEDVKSDEKED